MQKLKLNPQLFSEVADLIKTRCCNCYEENCLLLDDGETHICPQLITPSHIICRYFFESVLPGDKALLKRITEL
ncbi:MAG: cysteine-rich VLP protein [Clostridia bacterium]|nr:cysteine-rich VLP protein [Clostridia bacterium]